MLRFAANLTLLFKEQPFVDRFSAASRAGFSAVEFLFPYEFPADELANRLAEESLHQVLFNFPPGNWDAGERGVAALPGRQSEFLESMEQALEYARALKCPTLHVMAGIPIGGTSQDEALEVYIENLRLACDAASYQAITIVIEPLNTREVPGYLFSRSDQAGQIIDKVGRDNIGLQLDLYHCQIMEGDLETRIRDLANVIRHIQIAGVPARNEPDTGEINYPHLFKIIDDIGYDGWVGCEYNPRGSTTQGLGWFHAAKS
jgi:hydroxypyruvate isomerase